MDDVLTAAASRGARVVLISKPGCHLCDDARAIVHGYLGGQAGAEATMRVLTGAVNPSGRLAEVANNQADEVKRASSWAAILFAPTVVAGASFDVGEREIVRVLVKFGPHRGKYIMHCHNLPHEDHDMMVQFSVGLADGEVDANDPITAAPASWDDGS